MPKADSKKSAEASKRKTRSASDMSSRPKSCPKTAKAPPFKVQSSSSASLASAKPEKNFKSASPAHVQPSTPENYLTSEAPAANTPMLLRSISKQAQVSQVEFQPPGKPNNTSGPNDIKILQATTSPTPVNNDALTETVPTPPGSVRSRCDSQLSSDNSAALTTTAVNPPRTDVNSTEQNSCDTAVQTPNVEDTVRVETRFNELSSANYPPCTLKDSSKTTLPLSQALPPNTGVAQSRELEHVETLVHSVRSRTSSNDVTFLGTEAGCVTHPIAPLPPASSLSLCPPPHPLMSPHNITPLSVASLTHRKDTHCEPIASSSGLATVSQSKKLPLKSSSSSADTHSKTMVTNLIDLDNSENSTDESVISKTPKNKIKPGSSLSTTHKLALLPQETSFWSISSTNSKTTTSYEPSHSAKQNAGLENSHPPTNHETRSDTQDAQFRPVTFKRARRQRNPSKNSMTDSRPQNTKVFIESTLSYRLTNQLLKRSKYYQDILLMSRSQDETGYTLAFPDANTANLFMSTKTGSELDTFVKRPPHIPPRSVDILLSNLSDKIALTEIVEEIEEEYLIPIQSIYRLTRKTPDGIEYNTNTVKITISTEHEDYLINACKISGDARRQQLCLKLFCGIHPLTYAQSKPEPPQCTRCWRFMHVARMCKNPVRCKICAQNHPYSVCPHHNSDNHSFDKCANCGGPHRATWPKCEKYQECLQTIKKQLKKNHEDTYQKARLEKHSPEAEQVHHRQQIITQQGKHHANEQHSKNATGRSTSSLTEHTPATSSNLRQQSEINSPITTQPKYKINSPPKTYAQMVAEAKPSYRLASPPASKDNDAGVIRECSQSDLHVNEFLTPKPMRHRKKKGSSGRQGAREDKGQPSPDEVPMSPVHSDTRPRPQQPVHTHTLRLGDGRNALTHNSAQPKHVTYASHNSSDTEITNSPSRNTKRLSESPVDMILRNLTASLDAFSHPQFNGHVGIVQYISLLNLAYALLQRIVATINPRFPPTNNLIDHLECL